MRRSLEGANRRQMMIDEVARQEDAARQIAHDREVKARHDQRLIEETEELARAERQRERDKVHREVVELDYVNELKRKDWDDFSAQDQALIVDYWKRQHPNYTEDRDKLYRNLIANRVGTPYAHINNLNAHFSSYGRPIRSSLSMTSDADYYYDVVIPKSAAVLWWYESAFPFLSVGERTKWYTIIYVPNVMEATANLAEEVEEKGENIVGAVRGDVGSVLGGVGEGIGNAKYLFAGTAVVGVVAAIVVARK